MTKSVSIIVGSVLGATEYVADAAQECLEKKGYQCHIHLQPDLEDINPDDIWLVCTSTHGAGDLPDNIQPFNEQLTKHQLSKTKATVIGLGDSSYDTFCQGAETMENTLKNAGCQLLHPTLTIDVLQHPVPEDIAVEWLDTRF